MLGWEVLDCYLRILRPAVETVHDFGPVWIVQAERVVSVGRGAVTLEQNRAGWRRGGESNRD